MNFYSVKYRRDINYLAVVKRVFLKRFCQEVHLTLEGAILILARGSGQFLENENQVHAMR